MALYGVRQVGIAEKASAIALKYGVVYSIKADVFIGDAEKVALTTKILAAWKEKQWLKQRQQQNF